MRRVMVPNRLSREIDSMFNTFMNLPRINTENDCDFVPRVNIHETKDDVRLVFELPGMEKQDIKVTVKEDLLTVSGERKPLEADENAQFVRNEILTGSFSRSFTLPETIDTEKISADYRNGLLEVKLAKKEAVKPKEIEVSVG